MEMESRSWSGQKGCEIISLLTKYEISFLVNKENNCMVNKVVMP